MEDIVLQLINLRVILMPELDVMLTSKNMDSWCMCGHGVFTFLTLSIDRGMMLNYTKSSPIGANFELTQLAMKLLFLQN